VSIPLGGISNLTLNSPPNSPNCKPYLNLYLVIYLSTHFTLIGIRHARSTDLLSLHSNTEHYRDYESVFIVPGPSCHNQNRKQTFLKLNQSFL